MKRVIINVRVATRADYCHMKRVIINVRVATRADYCHIKSMYC